MTNTIRLWLLGISCIGMVFSAGWFGHHAAAWWSFPGVFCSIMVAVGCALGFGETMAKMTQ